MARESGAPTGQRALLEAIFTGRPAAGHDPRGLAVYRRNLLASAARALSISYPTVTCLLGRDRLGRLAGDFLQSAGRSVFDWGLWGEGFPVWLEEHSLCRQYPYLADSARLDWLMHCAQRAADARPDHASFANMEGLASLDFSLVAAPGCFVLESGFPVVAIHEAHRQDPARPDLGVAAAMLEAGRGQAALVWRQGPRTCLREARDEERIWLQLLNGGAATVAEALRRLPADSMPLEQWLDQAIREQLVIGLSHSSLT
ncbi:HvfC/BufC family peptide modification chaperone [Parahaliea mediterranea]|uniref:DNA-binding domain-containing protein n=1 Tax=Parahaliea mediterranea TaxID=651086 RepID=A0A939DD59_9GAMM|nr:putative DNA-binding domain-containing protein [Parahaliea mediterranea]